jgi:hypothetical protein
VTVPLPRLALPVLPDPAKLGHMVELALVVAMVCIMQTAAVASTFPSEEGELDDVGRNFAAVGAGNVLAGLFGAFAVDASPPSTAIVRQSGGRSQITSLAAVVLIVAAAGLMAGLLAYVPEAALSGILIYIALRLFRVDEMIRIWQRAGPEILLVAASAGLVVALPIETGMMLAIILSFVHSLYVIARPYCAELARVPGTPVWWPPSAGGAGEHEEGVLVFAPAAPLNFTNAEHISAEIRSAIAGRRAPAAAPGHRGYRHDRHRLYRGADPRPSRRRIAQTEHRRRDCPAGGRSGPDARAPHRPDRCDRPRPCVHVSRGGGAQARADRIAAELLRRSAQGEWPERPASITEGDVVLDSIGFGIGLRELYRGTGLAR